MVLVVELELVEELVGEQVVALERAAELELVVAQVEGQAAVQAVESGPVGALERVEELVGALARHQYGRVLLVQRHNRCHWEG